MCLSFLIFWPFISSSGNARGTGNWVTFERQRTNNTIYRLKQAAADPSALTQEAIIDNLDSAERGRLSRLRNIGIAVWTPPGDLNGKGD